MKRNHTSKSVQSFFARRTSHKTLLSVRVDANSMGLEDAKEEIEFILGTRCFCPLGKLKNIGVILTTEVIRNLGYRDELIMLINTEE